MATPQNSEPSRTPAAMSMARCIAHTISRLQPTPIKPNEALNTTWRRLPRSTRHSQRRICLTPNLLSGLCSRSNSLIFTMHFSLFMSEASPHVSAPHHLLAQRGKILLATTLYHLNIIRSPAQAQAGALPTALRASVDSHQERMAPAFDVERYLCRVGNDNGTYVQRVRCYSRHQQHTRARHDDGSAVRQRVGRTPRRGADDESVGPVGVEIISPSA